MEKTADLVTRILALVLVFFLGYFSCIGSMLGTGYILYSKISIDNLKKWGLLTLDTDQYLNPDAEAPLTSMTLKLLLKELSELGTITEGVTLDYMIDRYGLILPEAVDELLPDEVRQLKLNNVLSAEGREALLKGVKVKSLLAFVPAGTISEPAAETLGNRTLYDVMESGLGHLLTGVHLGYLVGVDYTKDEAGNFVVVLKDPEKPTLFELIAPIDVGEMLTVLSEGGDMMGVVRKSIGNVMLLSLVETLTGTPTDLVATIMEGKTLEDVLVMDENTGMYTVKLDALLEGRMFGELLGYTAVWSETDPPYIVEWQEDGRPVTGYMRGLASADAGILMTEDFEPSDLFADVYLGDFMNYTPIVDETGAITGWLDATGEPVNKAYNNLAMKSVAEMTSEGMEFDTLFTGIYVGDFYGYVYDEDRDVWTKEVSEGVYEDVTGMDRVIAKIEIGRLLSDEDYSITSEFEGMQLGELLGYTKEGDEWYQEVDDGEGGVTLQKVGAMESAIADADAADLMNGEFDIAETYKDVFVGDMMEYTRGDEILPEGGVSPELPQDREYEWYSVYDEENPENNQLVTGMEAKLANYSLYKLIKGEQKMDADTVTEGMTVAEILGLTERVCYVYDQEGNPLYLEGERVTVSLWYDENGTKANGVIGAMAQKEFSALMDSDEGFDSLYIGETLGQVRIDEKWYNLGEVSTYTDGAYEEYRVEATVATGMMTHLSDLTIGEMDDNSKVTEKIKGVKVGEAMGWTRVERVDEHGETVVVWYKTYDPVTGIGEEADGTMATLAEYPIGDLDTEIDQMPVGKLLGYKKVDGVWYKTYVGEGDPANEVADGVMKAIADIPVADLSDEINRIKIGEIMGWEYEEGDWYEVDALGNKTKATGIMVAFASLTLDEMSDGAKVSEVVRTVKVGDAMGWTLHDGVWYKTYVGEEDPANELADGTLGALADYPIGDINEEIKNLEVGKLLGWTQTEDGWVDESDAEVTGLMKVVAGYRVNELSTEINNVKIGTIMDWEYHDGKWYEVYDEENPERNVEASGIMTGFADLTMDEMSDAEKVSSVVQDLRLGDTMGWYPVSTGTTYEDGVTTKNVWYKDAEHTVRATGAMAALADYKVSELNDHIMDLTVGEAMGWSPRPTGDLYDDGTPKNKWYKPVTDPITGAVVGETLVTGFMGVIADHKIDEIEHELNNEQAGVLMGFEKRMSEATNPDAASYGQLWWHEVEYDEGGEPHYTPVSKMANTICEKKISEMGTSMNNLAIGEVYHCSEATSNKLKMLPIAGFSDWESLTIQEFCDGIIGYVAMLPPAIG